MRRDWEAILTDERRWPVTRHADEDTVISLLGPDAIRTRCGEWVLLEYYFDKTMWAFWWHRGALALFEMHTYLRRDFKGSMPSWFQEVSSLRLTTDLITTSRDFARLPCGAQDPDDAANALYCARNGARCRIDCEEGRAWKYLFLPDERRLSCQGW